MPSVDRVKGVCAHSHVNSLRAVSPCCPWHVDCRPIGWGLLVSHLVLFEGVVDEWDRMLDMIIISSKPVPHLTQYNKEPSALRSSTCMHKPTHMQ